MGIIRFVMCKETALQHMQGDAPSEQQIKAWAALDASQLCCPEVPDEHVQEFMANFVSVAQSEEAQFQTKMYDGLKAVVQQVGAGAFGGLSAGSADALLKRMPPDGPLTEVARTFVEVVWGREGHRLSCLCKSMLHTHVHLI